MDSYRVEKRASQELQLADADAEIDPVPVSGGGERPVPELDRLSNILQVFNDLFGNIDWQDGDRVRRLITEEIPEKVAADTAYRNAKQNSDKQNARIEHDKALARVIVGLMKDDTELFKQYQDNPGFSRWLADTVFNRPTVHRRRRGGWLREIRLQDPENGRGGRHPMRGCATMEHTSNPCRIRVARNFRVSPESQGNPWNTRASLATRSQC